MVQERHESTIEVNFDTQKAEASLNRLQSKVDKFLASSRTVMFGQGAPGMAGGGGGGIIGGGGGGGYGPRAPSNEPGFIGGYSTQATSFDSQSGLYVPSHMAAGGGGGQKPAGGAGGAGGATPVVPATQKGLIRAGLLMGGVRTASQIAQQEAAMYRSEFSGQVTRQLRSAQAQRRMVTSTVPTAVGAGIGMIFGPAGALAGGAIGAGVGGIIDSTVGAREDAEIQAVEARNSRAQRLAELRRTEGLTRFMGGLRAGPASRRLGASFGMGATQGAQTMQQFARAAGTDVSGARNADIFTAATMGADVGALGSFAGLSGRGTTRGGMGNAFGLLALAQNQGLRGAAASRFVSQVGGVAESLRGQGIRADIGSLQADVSGLAGQGLRGQGLTQALGGFRRVGAGVAQSMFGGMAQGIAQDAAFIQAAGRSGNMSELFENLRNLSARDVSQGIGRIAGEASPLADITRALTGNISMEEARGLRGMGAGVAEPLPELRLPQDLRDSLSGVVVSARTEVDMMNQIGTQNMVNLIEATSRAARAMESLADKVDTLKL